MRRTTAWGGCRDSRDSPQQSPVLVFVVAGGVVVHWLSNVSHPSLCCVQRFSTCGLPMQSVALQTPKCFVF